MAARGCHASKPGRTEALKERKWLPTLLLSTGTIPSTSLLKPSWPRPRYPCRVQFHEGEEITQNRGIQVWDPRQTQPLRYSVPTEGLVGLCLPGFSQVAKDQAETVTHICLYQRNSWVAQDQYTKWPDSTISEQNPACSTHSRSKGIFFLSLLFSFISLVSFLLLFCSSLFLFYIIFFFFSIYSFPILNFSVFIITF